MGVTNGVGENFVLNLFNLKTQNEKILLYCKKVHQIPLNKHMYGMIRFKRRSQYSLELYLWIPEGGKGFFRDS